MWSLLQSPHANKKQLKGAHTQYLVIVNREQLFETIDKSDFNPFLTEKFVLPQYLTDPQNAQSTLALDSELMSMLECSFPAPHHWGASRDFLLVPKEWVTPAEWRYSPHRRWGLLLSLPSNTSAPKAGGIARDWEKIKPHTWTITH